MTKSAESYRILQEAVSRYFNSDKIPIMNAEKNPRNLDDREKELTNTLADLLVDYLLKPRMLCQSNLKTTN